MYRIREDSAFIPTLKDGAFSLRPLRSCEVNEWVVAWTKPEYSDEIIGVHSVFKVEFREIKVEWTGQNIEYMMPEPLWLVLTTINSGNKPLALIERV